MGLLDEITSGLKGALSKGNEQGGLLDSVKYLLTSSETGGLARKENDTGAFPFAG